MTKPTSRRYTTSLDDDSLAALEYASAKTGLDSAVIIRALLFNYTSGEVIKLPAVPVLKSSAARVALARTNGLRTL
jgi:hypothetical protein